MTDIPIIFSAPMIRALLDGRKTMTRRLAWRESRNVSTGRIADSYQRPSPWQRAKPGDRLWVRETWQLHSRATDLGCVVYRASIGGSWTEAHEMVPVSKLIGKRLQPKPFQLGWRSPLHLSRDLSRLTLIVTGTKVERLNDISEADAIAEGAEINPIDHRHRTGFVGLWRSLHGDESWTENPEVVALTLRVIKANIDDVSPPHRTHTAALAGGI
jgi:hypothetical protein